MPLIPAMQDAFLSGYADNLTADHERPRLLAGASVQTHNGSMARPDVIHGSCWRSRWIIPG